MQVCRLADNLPNAPSCSVIARQVARSAASISANCHEAKRARTRKEFANKLQIALQEAEETRHWLKSIEGLGHADSDLIQPLIAESSELIAILVASVKTARRNTLS